MTGGLTETACAKVNLTLRVHGRRPDGFHELDSIVAFAAVGDVVTLEPASDFSFVAPDLDKAGMDIAAADNLVARAAAAFFAAFGPVPCRITLDKRLPIAAGVGGGSADAAATLRLLARTLPPAADLAAEIQRHRKLMALAEGLGSDVSVCLANRLIHMRGRGHDLTALRPIQPLPVVLLNLRAPVPANKTAAVFQALAAGPVPPDVRYTVDGGAATDAHALQNLLIATGNDLEAPARRVLPGVDAALAALSAQDGAVLVRMSGAGPTCFAIFPSSDEAAQAERAIRAANPACWVVASTLT